MPIDPIFQNVFERIYGLPAWRVTPGWGSFLTFEFGEPHLEIREPSVVPKNVSTQVRNQLAKRRVFIKGDWHLWINCCDWKVWSSGKLIGQSTSKPSIQRAADFLDGQKLVQFSIRKRESRCLFEFDLGGKLETRPYNHQGEQWFLYEKQIGKVFTLRADGKYSYGPADVADAEKWKPIQLPKDA